MGRKRRKLDDTAVEHGVMKPLALLAQLKAKKQTGQALVELLAARTAELEAVIRREKLVTLPKKPMALRLMTEADAAMSPVPTIDMRGFMARSRELAILVPPHPALDDFSYDAAMWPFIAHEGRPGHEL